MDNYENDTKVDIKLIVELIKEQRKVIKAPVDVMGCTSVADVLDKNKNFKIFIALLLSSQTKDIITYQAINNLSLYLGDKFTPLGMLEADQARIHQCIYKVGYHNKKLKYILECSKIMQNSCFLETVPTFDTIIKFPGIGKKMAYLYLSVAHNKNLGIGVDTHVARITNRLISKNYDTEKIRNFLEKYFPPETYLEINKILVGYGQTICTPIKPKCCKCNVKNHCSFYISKNINW